MTYDAEEVPERPALGTARRDDPVSAVIEDDARRALESFPGAVGTGPVFGVAERRDGGRWTVLALGEGAPQIARDCLGAYFRRTARAARDAGDAAVAAAYRAAAARMDREALNELAVARRTYRIIRGEQFLLTGADGPEPPRPTDPDPQPPARGQAPHPGRVRGFVLDPDAPASPSEEALRLRLLPLLPPPGSVPDEVRADAARARAAHPDGVLLPAEFAAARERHGRWEPVAASCPTPQRARESLAAHLRGPASRSRDADAASRAAYARAADRIEAERGDGLQVCGRRFRIVRVEQLVRTGPDGPEPPRASDHDPFPPVEVQVRQLGEGGLAGHFG